MRRRLRQRDRVPTLGAPLVETPEVECAGPVARGAPLHRLVGAERDEFSARELVPIHPPEGAWDARSDPLGEKAPPLAEHPTHSVPLAHLGRREAPAALCAAASCPVLPADDAVKLQTRLLVEQEAKDDDGQASGQSP